MDVRHLTSRVSAAPPMGFAVGALIADLGVLALPLNDGSSLLSYAFNAGFPLRAQVAYLLALFAQAVAILVGLMLLRRGQASMASGVFVGVLVILGFRVISSVLNTVSGWRWPTAVFVGLQTIECALLLLAARAAKQQGGASR